PIAVAPIELLGPGNAVGFANPATILADGGAHTATVTFSPVLDAFGNVIPDGSKVLASAASCASQQNGSCVPSAGGQVLNGGASPTSTAYSVYTVQNGAVTVPYADQGIQSSPGQIQAGNVVLLPSDAGGNRIGINP